jgi:hypothetical protein
MNHVTASAPDLAFAAVDFNVLANANVGLLVLHGYAP